MRECLDSVLADPFADWECILGVEESKDKTLEIAREYEAKDSRFKIFTARRSGSCSASRNTGTDLSRGQYVLFLDGDDMITKGSLARLHEKISARPGADLYPCVIRVFNEITGKSEPRRDDYPAGFKDELTGKEATIMVYSLHRAPCPMLQMTVFRREFLTANNLKCLHGRKRQDSEFFPRALYLAKRVIPLHVPFYIYRERANSISTLAKDTSYFLVDYSHILRSLFAFHSSVSAEEGFDKRISRLWARHWLTWLCYYFFAQRAIKLSPRMRRMEALRTIFAGGFADFDNICRAATFPRRIAAVFIKLASRNLALAWVADLFFACLYNPLTALRDIKSRFAPRSGATSPRRELTFRTRTFAAISHRTRSRVP